jgi:enediyne biosynthesis protein E8
MSQRGAPDDDGHMDIDLAAAREMTLEAFADTILPGEKRSPDDRAVAGVSTGAGAVAAGALDVLRTPEGGMAPAMDPLADALDALARQFAAERGIDLDPTVPAFVALDHGDRVDLVVRLTAVDNPERAPWVSLAMFSTIAFDAGAHRHTVEAMADGHPGLATMGFAPPDADGLWRFDRYSYGRRLASPHPDTTPSGSPS